MFAYLEGRGTAPSSEPTSGVTCREAPARATARGQPLLPPTAAIELSAAADAAMARRCATPTATATACTATRLLKTDLFRQQSARYLTWTYGGAICHPRTDTRATRPQPHYVHSLFNAVGDTEDDAVVCSRRVRRSHRVARACS